MYSLMNVKFRLKEREKCIHKNEGKLVWWFFLPLGCCSSISFTITSFDLSKAQVSLLFIFFDYLIASLFNILAPLVVVALVVVVVAVSYTHLTLPTSAPV